VIWLTAEMTPPARVRYPATVTTTAGSVTGAVTTAVPIAAAASPMFRRVLKKSGVGALAR